MHRVVKVLGVAWCYAAFAVIVAAYAMIAYRDGIGRLMAILSPFNVWNVLAVIFVMSPGLGLLKLAEHLKAKSSGEGSRPATRVPPYDL